MEKHKFLTLKYYMSLFFLFFLSAIHIFLRVNSMYIGNVPEMPPIVVGYNYIGYSPIFPQSIISGQTWPNPLDLNINVVTRLLGVIYYTTHDCRNPQIPNDSTHFIYTLSPSRVIKGYGLQPTAKSGWRHLSPIGYGCLII